MSETRLWKSDLEDGTFQNPVLFADYSDPDVIRVGDTFYLTASSFNYIPGLPILTSKDLVNWTLSNYAVTTLPYACYDHPMHAKGIWAPSIRFHDGMFYIFVGMPDEGIFMLKTADPLGKWSKMKLVLPGKGYIDPCPLWDEDGRAYVVHGYAKSRIGFKSILGCFEITPDGEHCISDDVFIFDGSKTQPTIEGPKIYKRNGLYYIFAPAGGVKPGWQTVLRSSSVYGPYEEKIVLHQGSSDINGPHQGGLVDTPSGEEWFLHFQDAGVFGRITHMQPVVFKDGWPVIGTDKDNSGIGEPAHRYPKPSGVPDVPPCYLEASDAFLSPTLGLQWQWLANARDDFYSLTKRPQALRLYAKNTAKDLYCDRPPLLWDSANVLTQKLICPVFDAYFSFELAGLGDNEQTGILMIGDEYASLAVRKTNGNASLLYLISESEETAKTEKVLFTFPVPAPAAAITFLLSFTKEKTCRMAYRFSESEPFREIPHSFLPKDHTWVGAKFGMYCIALDHLSHSGYADILSVTVTAKED